MAESSPNQRRAVEPRPNPTVTTFIQRIRTHVQNSAKLPLFVTASILLILTGVTVTVASLGFILFMPLILISSPIWFPVLTVVLVVSVGFFSACGFGVLLVAGLCWMYRYFRGMHPPGSDRVDYARSRIYDTANHVKDYAIEYGGYLQSRVKDAAPGA